MASLSTNMKAGLPSFWPHGGGYSRSSQEPLSTWYDELVGIPPTIFSLVSAAGVETG